MSFSESQYPQQEDIPMSPGGMAQISEDIQRRLKPELDTVRAETELLRRRSNFLMGMVIAFALILSGISIFLAIRLLALEQTPQATSVNTEPSEVELIPRIEALEKDIKALNESDVQKLAKVVQNNEAQLEKVISQLQRLSIDMQTLQTSTEGQDQPTNQRTLSPTESNQTPTTEPSQQTEQPQR